MDKKLGLEHTIRNMLTESVGAIGTDKFTKTGNSFFKSVHIEPKKGDEHTSVTGSARVGRNVQKERNSTTMNEDETIKEGAALKLPEPKSNPTIEMPDFEDSSKKYKQIPKMEKPSNTNNVKSNVLKGVLRTLAPKVVGPAAAFWTGLGVKPANPDESPNIVPSEKDKEKLGKPASAKELENLAKAKPAPKQPEKPAPTNPKPYVDKPANQPAPNVTPLPPKWVKPLKPGKDLPNVAPPANVPSKVPQRTFPDKLPTPANEPAPKKAEPAKTPAPVVTPPKPKVKPEKPAPATSPAPAKSPAPKPAGKPAAAPAPSPAPAPAPAPSNLPSPAAAPAPAPSGAPAPGSVPTQQPKPSAEPAKEQGKKESMKDKLKRILGGIGASAPSASSIGGGGGGAFVATYTHHPLFASLAGLNSSYEETRGLIEDADTAREKIENVARPNSGRKKAVKQAEIIRKIIDEQKLVAKKKKSTTVEINPPLNNPDEGTK